MSRVIFVNRFYAPDHSATAQILSDLATALSGLGHDIHILTSRGLYGDDRTHLDAYEIINGVSVHRVDTAAAARENLIRRARGYFSVYGAFYRKIRELTRPGDLVVAKTDPPLLSVVMQQALRRHRIHLVNWLQDVYPEIAVELGIPFLRGPVSKGLRLIRDRSLNGAQLNVVLGERMRDHLISCGVPSSSITIIPNWSRDQEVMPISHADNELRRAWGIENQFVVGYSGNLGRAHELETFLDAAQKLRDRPDISFLFIGGGHHVDVLKARVRELGFAEQVQFRPYQSEAMLKYSLSAADVHWLSLRDNLEGLIVPSKFYGIAATGRPIISVSARDGETGRLVQRYECGVQVDPGDGEGMAKAIRTLADQPQTWHSMAKNARAMIDKDFSRQRAIDQWDQLIRHIQASNMKQ